VQSSTAFDVANSLTVPLRRAIDDLLQLAADSVNAAVASVLVRDGDEGGLRFLTATGGTSEELLALRLPPGAGYCGVSIFKPPTEWPSRRFKTRARSGQEG